MHPQIAEDMKLVSQILHREGCIKNLRIVGEDECLIPEGGKQLRPHLVVLAARLCGYSGTAHIDYAVAIELIHNATLFHDDVIDSADIRRGKETLNIRHGNSFAILAGDYVMARSFGIIAKYKNPELFSMITDCVGNLVIGQMREMDYERNLNCTVDVFLDIIDNKTASLIATCLLVGGQIAAANNSTLNLLKEIGMKTGRLFQIADDVIDYLGTEGETGKKRFQDVKEGKITLPAILLAQRCLPQERDLFQSMLGKPEISGSEGDTIMALLEKYEIIKSIYDEYFSNHQDIDRLIDEFSGSEFYADFKELIGLITGRLDKYVSRSF
ncbi:MAG: polyprenyl synthetase family protein [bacterium]